MKIKTVTDFDKFFSAVQMCEGSVELVTQDGDRINLKSTLSQYVSIVRFFNSEHGSEMEIVTNKDDDKLKIFHYLVN